MRVGDVSASCSSCESASVVLRLSFVAVEAGRLLLTRSGERGWSGEALLEGNSKALGGSMVFTGDLRVKEVLLCGLHVFGVWRFGVDMQMGWLAGVAIFSATRAMFWPSSKNVAAGNHANEPNHAFSASSFKTSPHLH